MVNRAVLFGAPSYSQKILNLGPIAYWPLNDASGTAAVELVAGMNGTYSGVDLAQAQAPFVAPLFGDGDFCNIYSAGLNALKAFFTEGTVSIWAKVSGAGVWSDGVARRIFAVISASNQEDYTIRRGVTNEQIVLRSNLGGTAEAVKLFGADRGMVEQDAANGLRQMPVKLRRPCLASSSEHRPEIARRHTVGMRNPVQPA